MNEFLQNEFEIDSSSQKVPKKELSVPTNIKQIGEIQEGIQIYLEDYVHTYLYQYARWDTKKERLAVLIGTYEQREEEEILLISGAIQGKFIEIEKGQPHFTREAWDYIREKQRQYFPGTQILGWMHTQPGYGMVATSFHDIQHETWFGKSYQILYVIDPIGKQDQFYQWKEEWKEVPGYFIYYDRNEKMHDYMLDHRVIKSKVLEEPEDVIVQYRKQDRYRKQEAHQKKIIHMLTSFSAILLLICLVMGIGLIYNVEQIQRLQEALNTMDYTYTNLFTQIKGDTIEGVFAQEIEKVENEDEDFIKVKEGTDSQTSQIVKESVEKKEEEPQQSVEDQGTVKEQEASQQQEKEEVVEEEEKKSQEQSVTVEESSEPSQEKQEPEIKKEVVRNPNIPEQYTIQKGDNLSNISYRFYNTTDMVDAILQLNNLSNPNKIYAGKTIQLP
ncbi:MAG: LysM peptidoglycan-binding domain-containing protein [Epulopiscium sp.]|nr:LysM peptidoglycan-binding domain-containing protein [Candidatus Epulonipiscium sp.]